MKKTMITMLIALTLISTSIPSLADNGDAPEIVADIFLARPAGFVLAVLGTAVFLVALPFAVMSRSVEPTARTLVAEPFQFTFTRPVGDFSSIEY